MIERLLDALVLQVTPKLKALREDRVFRAPAAYGLRRDAEFEPDLEIGRGGAAQFLCPAQHVDAVLAAQIGQCHTLRERLSPARRVRVRVVFGRAQVYAPRASCL